MSVYTESKDIDVFNPFTDSSLNVTATYDIHRDDYNYIVGVELSSLTTVEGVELVSYMKADYLDDIEQGLLTQLRRDEE